ncbi:hypothetical protein COCOBI_12-4470 [Coccomyxa sp. Obi]|nr:hypothetical protein COCOBI_12-4470 [Coccomyxa sp. Obi]
MRKHCSGMLVPRSVRVTAEQNNRKKCPQLGKEIWELIAARMPLKDWIRVSLACKQLYKVEGAKFALVYRAICPTTAAAAASRHTNKRQPVHRGMFMDGKAAVPHIAVAWL